MQLTNFRTELSLPITECTTFLIDEGYKIIQITTTIIIFTSFIALWEKFQCRIATNTISVLANFQIRHVYFLNMISTQFKQEIKHSLLSQILILVSINVGYNYFFIKVKCCGNLFISLKNSKNFIRTGQTFDIITGR